MWRNHPKLFSVYLVLTVFITGAIVMLIEIAGARVIAPLFGSSVFVWTAVISVTLLSLAMGYFQGGRSADKGHAPGFLYGVIFASGAYLLFTVAMKKAVMVMAVHLDIRLGALVSSLVLFAPPLFFLGMVSPLAVKLYARQLEKIGSRVGMLYFVSTLGSFLGTLFTGFFLIPHFGVSRILLFASVILMAVPLGYFFFSGNPRSPVLLIFLLPAISLFAPERLSAVSAGGVKLEEIYKAESFYGRLKVVEVNGLYRFFLIDGANQGGVAVKDGSSAVTYTYVLEELAGRYCPEMKRCLVIGLGTGVIPNAFSKKGIVTDVVDIDQKVAVIYREYFARYASPDKVRIHIDDGRCFIKKQSVKYDLVILDALLGDVSPWHLLTAEAFWEIKNCLVDGGSLLINLVGLPRDKRSMEIIDSVHATLARVFPYTCVFNRGGILGDKAQNMFFAASLSRVSFGPDPEVSQVIPRQFIDDVIDILRDRSEQYNAEAFLLTDDYNPLDFYNARAREEWRREILASADKGLMLE